MPVPVSAAVNVGPNSASVSIGSTGTTATVLGALAANTASAGVMRSATAPRRVECRHGHYLRGFHCGRHCDSRHASAWQSESVPFSAPSTSLQPRDPYFFARGHSLSNGKICMLTRALAALLVQSDQLSGVRHSDWLRFTHHFRIGWSRCHVGAVTGLLTSGSASVSAGLTAGSLSAAGPMTVGGVTSTQTITAAGFSTTGALTVVGILNSAAFTSASFSTAGTLTSASITTTAAVTLGGTNWLVGSVMLGDDAAYTVARRGYSTANNGKATVVLGQASGHSSSVGGD